MKRSPDTYEAPAPRRLPRQRPGREGGKRDENRRLRTRDLCLAGLTLFLQRGIEAVAIDDIVRAAHMAKGSFYRYFKDKTDLVEAILSPMAARVDSAFEEAGRALAAARTRKGLFDAYRLLSERIAGAILQDTQIALLYLQECRSPGHGSAQPVRKVADRLARNALELTRIAHEHKLLRPIDPRVSALAVIGAVERLLFGVLTDEDLGDVLSIPEALISMILDGLRPKRGGSGNVAGSSADPAAPE